MKKENSGIRIGVIITTAVIIVLITLVCLYVTRPLIEFLDRPEEFRSLIESWGAWGPLIYIGMVILQTVAAFIPGEPFEIAAGYAFGTVRGTLFCLAAEGIGSLIVLLLVRRLGTKLAECMFSKEKLESVRFLKGSESKMILFTLIFIMPGTPKDLLCYYAGLTDMSFGVLAAVCFIGRFPAIITSVVGGNALGSRKYVFAVIVFAATALVSIGGILLYNRLNEAKARKKDHDKTEK